MFHAKTKAHDIENSEILRTKDVYIEQEIDFNGLLLSSRILQGLHKTGFKKPSPIQFRAIPLGRCGFDMVIKAKSGTGKTCVFGVIALEKLLSSSVFIQTLILAPTREIAVQIKDVISDIGQDIPNLKVHSFIGGLSIKDDQKKALDCNIAVGAPGRIKHLITKGFLNISHVNLLVLDEADKLMDDCFQEDIKNIMLNLPNNKQIIASSATLSENLDDFILKYMHQPVSVTPSLNEKPVLLGLKQFAILVPFHLNAQFQINNKFDQLITLLKNISFKQCIIFSNYQTRAESMCHQLTKAGWPAKWISGSQDQENRLETVTSLKEYRCRVLLTTDLTARGIDAENINLVINLDLPRSGATYLHRIGRAGRYGTYGLAISLVASGKEMEQFRTMLGQIGGEEMYVLKLPKEIPKELWDLDESYFEKIQGIPLQNLNNEIEFDNTKNKNYNGNKNKMKSEPKTEVIQNNLLSALGKKLLNKASNKIKILSYEQINELWKNFDVEDDIINKNLLLENVASPILPKDFSSKLNDELNSRIEIPIDIDISKVEECLQCLIDGTPLPICSLPSCLKISPVQTKSRKEEEKVEELYYQDGEQNEEEYYEEEEEDESVEKKEKEYRRIKNKKKTKKQPRQSEIHSNSNSPCSFNYTQYDYPYYDARTNSTNFKQWYSNFKKYTKIAIQYNYYWAYMNE